MTDSLLDRAERFLALAKPLELAEARAKALQQQIADAQLFVGLKGCTLVEGHYDIIPEFIAVRRLSNPPGVVHVCRAANLRNTDYLGVSRHSGHLSAELLIGGSATKQLNLDVEAAHDLAWHLIALLKLQGIDSLCCPASSSVSWDTVAAVKDQSISFRLLDDIPRHIAIDGPNAELTAKKLAWAGAHYEEAFRLRDHTQSRRFGLAFNIAYTWNHTADPRLALANVWSALEAMFGDQNDSGVTKSLARRIESWMPGASSEDVRLLYKHRCDAVHGRWIEIQDIKDPLQQSIRLLRGSLIKCIETSAVPLPDWGA